MQGRVLTVKLVKEVEAGPTIQTIWELGDGEDGHKMFVGCRQYCGKDVQGNHNSFHKQTDDRGN